MNAPGLIRMPSAQPRASWMASISAPSWLDWRMRSSAPRLRRGALERRVDLGQRRAAVDPRLARAEQVQVGAVEDEDAGHGCLPLVRSAGFSPSWVLACDETADGGLKPALRTWRTDRLQRGEHRGLRRRFDHRHLADAHEQDEAQRAAAALLVGAHRGQRGSRVEGIARAGPAAPPSGGRARADRRAQTPSAALISAAAIMPSATASPWRRV